jgi:pimeloyl-ACP methyl ester carboxylesterase
VRSFRVDVGDDVLTDLRERIVSTRWPTDAPGAPWTQGTDLEYLRGFLAYWADEFDWAEQQRRLNTLNHFETDIDGVHIHFVHQRAVGGGGVPLLLMHGWPSCFLEYEAAIPLLTDPAAHGIDGPAFNVVVPSLPGYGFSKRPSSVGVNYGFVAERFVKLMWELGYDRFGAGGGDFGSGIAAHMALQSPDRLIGLHLTNIEIGPEREGKSPLTSAEEAFLAERADWDSRERGYSAIQSTRPQTLGYALTDSPAGLAAWLLEKWRSWTDSGGDPLASLSPEFLATMLTIYWATGSITASMRDYYDNRWHGIDLGPDTYVNVPTAVAVFDHEHVKEADPPRIWVERMYNVQRWTDMPFGGHFAPAEQPELFASDVAAAFADFTSP